MILLIIYKLYYFLIKIKVGKLKLLKNLKKIILNQILNLKSLHKNSEILKVFFKVQKLLANLLDCL